MAKKKQCKVKNNVAVNVMDRVNMNIVSIDSYKQNKLKQRRKNYSEEIQNYVDLMMKNLETV
jgi:hypothetical protein